MLWPGGVLWGVGWNLGGLPGVYGVPDSIFVKIIDPREDECPWLLRNKPPVTASHRYSGQGWKPRCLTARSGRAGPRLTHTAAAAAPPR